MTTDDANSIRWAKKRSHLLQLYLDDNLDLTVPWKYVLHSRIVGLIEKHRG